MTRAEFTTSVVERRIELIKKVLASKGTEYGADKSAFHNFEQGIGISFHDTPQAIAWEYMCKHLQSVKDLVENNEKLGVVPEMSLVEEKIGDAINYLILIEGMFQKQNLELEATKKNSELLVSTTSNYDKIKYITDDKKS
jgi:hypothetical protein